MRDGLELSYVVLRPSLEDTLARATAREGDALTEVEPVQGLHGAFAELGELERGVLDSSAQTADRGPDRRGRAPARDR